jgi:hypothetical protein
MDFYLMLDVDLGKIVILIFPSMECGTLAKPRVMWEVLGKWVLRPSVLGFSCNLQITTFMCGIDLKPETKLEIPS